MTGTWSASIVGALKPQPRLTVSEWADRYRVVPRGTSPEPGPWRTSRVPYLRDILDAISDPATERVTVQAASQLGKSELELCLIGYYADADPAPILVVQPTEIAARAFSQERVGPMFRASPALRGKLSEQLRDPDNTIMLRQFPGGMLAFAWATSAVSLASRPIRVVLLDEVDRFPETTGRDGDPIAQAVQRTSNFANRKIVAVSTPTIDGLSPIADLYDQSDEQRLWVPCPRCGAYQVLEWSGLVYKNAAGEVDLDDVHYRCAHCGDRIEERDRPAMLEACEWRAEHPERGVRHRGYQLSALYSPWVRWRTLAEEWTRAMASRDRQGLQAFVNLRLGETWTEASGSHVEAGELEANRETYDDGRPDDVLVPDGALALTAGVDVQDNRFEVEVVGWGLGRESWGVQYHVIAGDTAATSTWLMLDAFLARTWERADGTKVGLLAAAIDTGGHRTSEAYLFCRQRGHRRIFGIKGVAGPARPIVGKPSPGDHRRPVLFPVGVDTAKEALFSRLSLKDAGPGYCHFPMAQAAGYDTAYFRGLVSEEQKTKIRAGRRVRFWKQLSARNEPLDCRVYAIAALDIVGPDFDSLAAHLERLPRGPTPFAPPVQSRRRVYSRGVA